MTSSELAEVTKLPALDPTAPPKFQEEATTDEGTIALAWGSLPLAAIVEPVPALNIVPSGAPTESAAVGAIRRGLSRGGLCLLSPQVDGSVPVLAASALEASATFGGSSVGDSGFSKGSFVSVLGCSVATFALPSAFAGSFSEVEEPDGGASARGGSTVEASGGGEGCADKADAPMDAGLGAVAVAVLVTLELL